MKDDIRRRVIDIANQFNATEQDIKSFYTVIKFLDELPDYLSLNKKTLTKGSKEYFDILAQKFFSSRKLIENIKEPGTVPDELVSYILQICFNYSIDDTERIKKEHQLSMSAENKIGELLERYLATVLEPLEWSWCSGNFVKSIDFIRQNDQGWDMLQIKNRNNTENSSSSSVRKGTTIYKWFRSFSTKKATNWQEFPDENARLFLSEESFKKFVETYFLEAKKVNPTN